MATEPFLLQQLKPLPGGAVLTRAAASIAMASGTPQTIVDILHGRAFRYYAEGLRQYLAVRSGSVERAERHLQQLRAFAAKSESNELVQPPGIRARLYKAARKVLHDSSLRSQGPSHSAREALPWRASSPQMSISPLHGLRFDLDEEDSELLELRYARELSIEELAFVFDVEASDMQQEVEAATARAQILLDGYGIRDRKRFPRVIIEAFALQPRPRSAQEELSGIEPLSAGTIVGGRYAVETRVGLGAFGDVYRAKDTEVPGHVVALKLLHLPAHSESSKQAALRELRLIASVFHPSIVQFKDHGWFEGRLWFVMPWYDGETLESRVQREPLNRNEAREIFEPLARALATMHSAGVRHQDVKPDNIFLAQIPGFGDEEILPILLDLGVAATDAEMVVAGTPTYFAPEVAAQFASVPDKPAVTAKADVFALALSLRNALDPASQEDVAGGAVESFIEYRAREVPDAPKSKDLRFLSSTFDRWMNMDAEQRPTADQLAEELAVLTRPEERRRRIKGVMQWALPMVFALVAASGSAVSVFYQQAETQREEAARTRIANAGLRQDLRNTMEAAEQLQLEYERSQLTRTQLAERLASTQGRVTRLKGKVREEEKRLALTRTTLETTRTAREQVEAALSKTEERLAEEEGNARLLGERLELEEGKVAKLRGDLAAARVRLDAEQSKTERLQAAMARAITEKSRTEAELELLRYEFESLQAQQKRRKGAPKPSPEPAEETDTLPLPELPDATSDGKLDQT